jgi:RNA polymerase sigma factor for flagellar operon FliA
MDEPASSERIIAHLAFARAVAARSLDPRCRGADREDLIAWGVVGLVQAAQRYRGDLGASFGAYAARRVRGQVLDALRERDPLTRSARRAYREARLIAEDLPPPYVEISLDRLAELGDGGIPAPDEGVPAGANHDPRWDGVARELRSLTRQERRVIVLSYGRGLTLREIGVQVGLSESGVCRVRARALRRLRSAIGEQAEAA